MQPRSVVASVLLALLGLSLQVEGTSAREAPGPVTVKDPTGDVRIYMKAKGLTRAQRVSIDLRRVTIAPRARAVRISVELRAVPRRMPVDQMVFLALSPAPGSSATGRG